MCKQYALPPKDVVKGIKEPCKNKLQTQPRALSHLLSHSPTPIILRVPLDPAGAGPGRFPGTGNQGAQGGDGEHRKQCEPYYYSRSLPRESSDCSMDRKNRFGAQQAPG